MGIFDKRWKGKIAPSAEAGIGSNNAPDRYNKGDVFKDGKEYTGELGYNPRYDSGVIREQASMIRLIRSLNNKIEHGLGVGVGIILIIIIVGLLVVVIRYVVKYVKDEDEREKSKKVIIGTGVPALVLIGLLLYLVLKK